MRQPHGFPAICAMTTGPSSEWGELARPCGKPLARGLRVGTTDVRRVGLRCRALSRLTSARSVDGGAEVALITGIDASNGADGVGDTLADRNQMIH